MTTSSPTRGLLCRPFFAAEAPHAPTAEALDSQKDGPTPTPSECSDYWDPPCRVCKKVDNEPNVLCDICNGAYHLDCLANIKPPLPRTPDDDEWFCRSCIKRGIPESIIDRVGRGSFAFYLVKWIGRPAWEVSWENADVLDTPWSRKLIRGYMETERCGTDPPLLPPSHPLIDRLQHGEVQALGPGSGSGSGHLLGPVAREAGELLALHPHCAALAQCGAPAQAAAREAAGALRAAREALELALAPAMEAAKAAAIQQQARAQAQADARRAATHSGTAYQGFLLYLREQRPRLRAALPAATGRAVEKAAAEEWRALEPQARRQAVERAAALLQGGAAKDGAAKDDAAKDDGEAGEAGGVQAGGTPAGGALALAPAELQQLLGEVQALGPGSGSGSGHLLGPVAREAGELLALHPHCAALAQCGAPAQAAAREAAGQAAGALRAAREALELALGPEVQAAKVAAIQQRARAAQADARRAATHSGTAYQGFLLYLREQRPRLRAALPAATGRAVEKAAAEEWRALEPQAKRQAVERAAALLQQNARAPNADGGAPPTTLADISTTTAVANGAAAARGAPAARCDTASPPAAVRPADGRRGAARKPPCDVCGKLDKRDYVTCADCGARAHLMCFFPPWEAVGKGEAWRCSSCACAPPPPLRELVPAVGEELEVEVQEASGAVAWKPAVVRRAKGRTRFVACVNGEADFLEEYGLEEGGSEWRRAPAAVARLEAGREARAAAAAEAAAHVARLDARLEEDARPVPSALLPQVEALYRDGLCEAGCGISEEQVERCFDVVSKGYEQYMHAVKTLDLQERLLQEGFMQIKMRHIGRYDLQLPELSTPPFSFLLADAPWMPLVRAALGADAVLTHFGCMLSFPGSATQPWHSDGPHMPGGDTGTDRPFVAPVHAVNVFVPLVDLTAANGPTEFTPGSQVDFDLDAPSRTPLMRAGQALIFDYRTRHRGLGNSSGDERPLLYLTYARPFFLDVYNFDSKRYQQLPEVQQLSREERMQKRKRG